MCKKILAGGHSRGKIIVRKLALSCTAKTKYGNFNTNIPRKGISGSQSQFPKAVSETIDR
jgi:hypothetical protein